LLQYLVVNSNKGALIMDKKQIAKVLEEMALLLEIKGENIFKVRAHENAARALEGLTGDLEKLVESGEIIEIKGIGKWRIRSKPCCKKERCRNIRN